MTQNETYTYEPIDLCECYEPIFLPPVDFMEAYEKSIKDAVSVLDIAKM